MSDLAAIVKNVANDMVEAGEKAGRAFVKHLTDIGGELKESSRLYKETDEGIARDVGKIRSDGISGASRDGGGLGRGAGGGVGRDADGLGKGAGGARSVGSEGGDAPLDPEASDGHLDGDSGASADPVDVVTGDMFLPLTDLELPGVLPLVLHRRFSSGYRDGQFFGPRWSSTLDQRVQIGAGGIRFVTGDGRVLHYPVPGAGEKVLPSFGPRWELCWDREDGRDEIRIEQGEHGRVLTFLPGPEPGSERMLSSVADRGGNRYEFDYSDSGIPEGIRHSAGYHVLLGTDVTLAGPRVTSIRLADPGGGEDLPVRTFRYTLSGNLTETYDPDSPLPMRLEYDSEQRVTSWTDRNGNWYRYAYRADGRVSEGRGPDGFLDTTFDYDLPARTTTMTDALGHSWVYHWNPRGQVEKAVDPLGGECFTEQDEFGNVLSNTDQLGRRTAIERNAAGDPVRVTGPDGSGTVLEYDARRLPVRAEQSDGRAWTYEHGPHGQVTAITNPLGAVTRFAYDSHGRPVSTADPLDAATRYRCDPAGQPTEVTDALGAVTVIRRDAFGRVTQTVDPAGATTTYTRSPGGRLLSTQYPDGAVEQWEYDAEGNVSRITSPTGAVTSFTYGPFDKPVTRTDPDGSVYRFSYDAMLRLTTVTGPAGLTWHYEFDGAGRLVSETGFDSMRVEYALDAAGQLIARSTPAGTVEFTRDPAGRVTERRADGQVTRFSYGIAGRLVRAENDDSVLEYAFDGLGQAVSETVNGRSMTSAYDLAGRRVERVTPGGVTTRWTYDAAGQHTGMTGTAGTLAFSYDQAGRETGRLLGPGAAVRSTYDLSGRPATEAIWKYPHRDASAPAESSGPVQVQARAYSYLADGTPSEIHDDLRGTRRFELDESGRITRVHAGSWQASYAYDELGNLAWSSDPDTSGDTVGEREIRGTKIRRAGRTVYEYDQAGRLVRRTRRTLSGQSRTWRFTWNATGQLVSSELPGGESWHYAYDGLGRRISKTRYGADGSRLDQVLFDWDGPRVAEETITGPDDRAVARTWDYEPASFVPVAQTRRTRVGHTSQDKIEAEFHAIVTDLVGTPTELVTPNGDVEWHTTASVWGKAVTAPGSTADCPLRFPGQFHDEETGLDYNLNRYYDPDLGAYLTPDPLGFAAGVSNTAYVANPLIQYDPLGLFSCPVEVQKELAQFRKDTNMKSVADENETPPRNTVGKMEFDGGRDPVYGKSGQLPDRNAAYPGKGHQITATSFQDHAEGDMVHQAGQKGYSGGNARISTDRDTCSWCRNSMHGYVKRLNLDSLEVYDPTGHVGTWYKGGTFTKGPAWHW